MDQATEASRWSNSQNQKFPKILVLRIRLAGSLSSLQKSEFQKLIIFIFHVKKLDHIESNWIKTDTKLSFFTDRKIRKIQTI